MSLKSVQVLASNTAVRVSRHRYDFIIEVPMPTQNLHVAYPPLQAHTHPQTIILIRFYWLLFSRVYIIHDVKSVTIYMIGWTRF